MSLYDRYVPPEGPSNARVMLIGEGPGKQEAADGRPFVGSTGKEVDKLLKSVGFDREEVWLSNITKYYPKGKKNEAFFQAGHPTKFFMDGIIEIVQEINEVKPNVVVPLGNFALWGLTQESGIFSWRGSILESTLVKGQKVVPTIHPAWFLRSRQWHQYPLVEWDFQRVAEESRSPEINLPNPEIIIDPTPQQIHEAVDRFLKADLLTLDTEWYSPESLAYIGFSDDPNYAFVIPANSMLAYRAFKEILSSDVPKVMQNAMFDVVALDRVGIEVRNVVHDTMIAWNACWGDLRKKGLDVIGSVLTRHPYYKEDVEFVGKDDEKGQEYCGRDCVVTQDAMETMLDKEFNITGAKRGYETSMSIMDTFLEASKVGIRADTDLLMKLKDEYISRADALEDSVSERIGWSVNCRSWQQVRKAVYDDLGMGKKYKTRSTAQDKLMDIAASENSPEIKQLLTDIIRVRQDRNMVSRYINEDIIDRDGRIRCTWNLAGTRNGRLSTTEPWWNGVAIQTVPDDAREVFIADPGHTFIGFDYEQADARVVAVLTRDYDLLDDMAAGVDIHAKLGAQMGVFDMTYEDFLRRMEEEGKDNVAERYLSKKCRHSLNYYGTWYTLKQSINREYLDTGVGVDAAISKQLHKAYLDVCSNIESWWDEVYHTVRNDGKLTNAFGRTRTFLGRMAKFDHLHRDAIAFYPQSTVADLTTTAIARIDKRSWTLPLTHMHDGALVQVPLERRDEAVEFLMESATMEIVVGRELLTIPVEIKEGQDWKNMKRVAV